MRHRVIMAVAAALAATMTYGTAATPANIAVAPSGATVPARLLRISVKFAASQAEGLGSHTASLSADGTAIGGALIEQQLWSPDRRTLTLLLDPGRVKDGLIAHDQGGPVLRAGENLELRISDQIIHRWTVVAGGCVAPDPGMWTLTAPRRGTRERLRLVFPGPLDALSRDLIAIADSLGNRVKGSANFAESEKRWSFVPVLPWPHGVLSIVVHPRLENPCGDEPGEPFEHAARSELAPNHVALRRPFVADGAGSGQ